MKIGFTGTRAGMTGRQKQRLRHHLLCADEFHHGCCVGSDAEAHAIAIEMGVPIIGHPPTDERFMAKLTGFLRLEKPLPFLERNKAIVNDTDLLLACPQSEVEEIRSGMWSTVRYSRKQSKARLVINP